MSTWILKLYHPPSLAAHLRHGRLQPALLLRDAGQVGLEGDLEHVTHPHLHHHRMSGTRETNSSLSMSLGLAGALDPSSTESALTHMPSTDLAFECLALVARPLLVELLQVDLVQQLQPGSMANVMITTPPYRLLRMLILITHLHAAQR